MIAEDARTATTELMAEVIRRLFSEDRSRPSQMPRDLARKMCELPAWVLTDVDLEFVVRKNPEALAHVDENRITHEMCVAALASDASALKLVPPRLLTRKLYLAYAEQHASSTLLAQEVPKEEMDAEMCSLLVGRNMLNFYLIPEEHRSGVEDAVGDYVTVCSKLRRNLLQGPDHPVLPELLRCIARQSTRMGKTGAECRCYLSKPCVGDNFSWHDLEEGFISQSAGSRIRFLVNSATDRSTLAKALLALSCSDAYAEEVFSAVITDNSLLESMSACAVHLSGSGLESMLSERCPHLLESFHLL